MIVATIDFSKRGLECGTGRPAVANGIRRAHV